MDNGTIMEVLEELSKIEKDFCFYPKLENVTLILGNTGCGKSTLVERLVGRDAQLKAVQSGMKVIIEQPSSDKIGHNISISKTTFPNLEMNAKTGAIYCDMPGFGDTRRLPYVIGTTYFIKKVVDSIQRVKLIFLTNFSSLNNLGSRDDFTKLLENLSKFVRNVDKFKHSIALIVTKVEDSPLIKLSDEVRIVELAKTIREASNAYKSDFKQFTDIILENKEGHYPKIAISKSPDAFGWLNEIPSIVANTANLTSMIDELNFTQNIFHTDFGYSMPKDSYKEITDTVASIKSEISSSIARAIDELQKYLINKENRLEDIFKLKNETQTLYDQLTQIKQAANTQVDLTNCIFKLRSGISTINNDPSYIEQLKTAEQYSNFLSFLQNLHENSLNNDTKSYECAKPLENIIEKARQSKLWYTFLTKLHSHLSTYEIQNANQSSCHQFVNNNVSSIKIDQTLSSDLFQELKKCYADLDDDISTVTIDQSKFNALQGLFNFTMTRTSSDISYDSETDTLLIKGRYVKFTDIPGAIREKCENKVPKTVQIFALNTIFVDSDLNLTANLKNTDDIAQLFIMAPTWEIRGAPKIILDGMRALSRGENPAGNGKAGKAGLAGGLGGTFLGIGANFINLEYLTISANGGDGGAGQDGGKGEDGSDGLNAKDSLEDCTCDHGIFTKGGCCTKAGKNKVATVKPRWEIFDKARLTTEPVHLSECVGWEIDKTIYGTYSANGAGADGCDGGKGGMGGYAGYILFFPSALFNTTIRRHSQHMMSDGSTGSEGAGGVGGAGGKRGNDIRITTKCSPLFSIDGTEEFIRDYEVTHNERSPSGKNGTKGASTEGQSFPKPKLMLNQLNLSQVINHYKSYLRENLNNTVIQSHLLDFHFVIENDQTIDAQIYNTLGFLDDLEKLESQYYELRNFTDFLPFYQSLIQRLTNSMARNNYSQNEQISNSYLRTTLLSRILTIENNMENYTVVDVQNYIALVKEEIQVYKDTSKNLQISNYLDNYQSSIREQITQADKVIRGSILPDIDQIYDQIDKNIRTIIADIKQQVNNTEKNIGDLSKKKAELISQLPIRTAFGVMKTVASIVAATGPWGAVVGGTAGAALNTIDTGLSKAIVDAKSSISYIKDTYKHKQSLVKINFDAAKLEETEKTLKLMGEEGEKLASAIDKVKYIIKQDTDDAIQRGIQNADDATQDSLKYMEKKREEYLKKTDTYHLENQKEEAIRQKEKAKIEADKRYEKHLEIGTRLQGVLLAAESGVQLFNQLEQSSSDLSDINDKIREARNEIKNLKMYEDSIRMQMIPEINTIEKQLSNNLTNLSDLPQVNLDVQKWKFDNFLKDFKLKMEYLIQEPSDPYIKAKLLACIDKLQGGIVTMIQIYDRIQKYKQQQKLVQYIADINSRVRETSDSELNKKIDKLRLTLVSNLVLLKYEKVLNTFKQYIFPYANLYLDQFDITSHLASQNINHVVNSATEQIDQISKVLTEKGTTINNRETIFSDEKFYGNSSFFSWKFSSTNEKESISALLKGETITLNADVRKSNQLNAVKFKEIGIRFTFANETMQNKFDLVASNFKIIMVHLGDSHYRCDDKYYIFTHDVINLTHSVNAYNTYENADNNYKIIRKNEPIFSPYATWKLKLYPNPTLKNKPSISEFRQFVNQSIDLSLEGVGGYIHLNSDTCKSDLEKYYFRIY